MFHFEIKRRFSGWSLEIFSTVRTILAGGCLPANSVVIISREEKKKKKKCELAAIFALLECTDIA